MSVTFSWDIERAYHLVAMLENYYPVVKIGGPAIPGPFWAFTPGEYVKAGVTFTSRGCQNRCPWCLVPSHEGSLIHLDNFKSGNLVQDNNLLQCDRIHLRKVMEMLKGQRAIHFSGGLDAELLTWEIAEDLRGLRVQQIFLACDTANDLRYLQRAITRLSGFTRDKLRCYVLLAFNGETISEATARLEDVWEAGCLPFSQLYQPADEWIDYPKAWRDLNRSWSRPAAMKAMHKEKS